MRILWISPFLHHPTLQGGQIRSLSILKKLHEWHEVHFASMWYPEQAEGRARTSEYCSQSYLVPHSAPAVRSLAFVPQALANLTSPLPLTVARDISPQMRTVIEELQAKPFDVTVCDFASTAVNIRTRKNLVLFQHNVETMIWRRLSQHGATPLHRWYFGRQANRMYEFEKGVCREVRHVLAVSDNDAALMREMFDIQHVTAVPTGVDLDYFERPKAQAEPTCDLVFTGSMNWMANIDGILWFAKEVLPLIRKRRPRCTVAVVGRNPVPAIVQLGKEDPLISVTGTVPDVRPYLWNSRVAIVPLRVGGGTRLKIYEAMAAGIPQVSTAVGAEGLTVHPGQDIQIADSPEEFAASCLRLLDDDEARRRVSAAARDLVVREFSWDRIGRSFEAVLLETAGKR